MSVDTDNAKISDNQDEGKKPGDVSTEDDSSQESKGAAEVGATPKDNGEVKAAKEEDGDDKKEEDDEKSGDADVKSKDVKEEAEPKETKAGKGKAENGESHDTGDGEKKKTNDVKKKKAAPKKEESEEEEEDEEDGEEEEEEEDDGDEGEVKKKPAPAKKPAPKKKAVKETKGSDKEDDDEEEEEDDGEEEEEEEEEEEAPAPKKKKEPTEPPVPVPAGKGIPLGHIPNVEVAISRFKIEDLKFLHNFLYNQICRTNLIKRNIKKFKGYEFEKDSSEYKSKIEEVQKLEPKQLRMLCEMLDLDKRGGPSDLATRVVGFLVLPKNCSPHARGAIKERPPPSDSNTPGGRPRRNAAIKVNNRGYSDEEYETDPESKVRGPKVAREDSAESDGSYNPSGSGQDADSDFDPAGGEGPLVGRKRKASGARRSAGATRKKSGRGRPKQGSAKKAKVVPKRGGRGRKPPSDSEEESESESGSEAAASDSEGQDSDPLTQEPPSKKAKAVVIARGRKPATPAKPPPKAAVVSASKRKAPPPPPPAKKKGAPPPPAKAGKAPAKGAPPKGKGRKAASSSEDESEEDGSEDGEEEEEDEDGSEEEDRPLNAAPAKKGKHPPTDDEIKKYVKQILEGANLEEITMKTVCKQVYSHYPDFDLAHKKDFIKATVKSLISS